MATQICPNCKKDSFTWHIDDENSKLTIWGCYQCYYQAFEDESKMTRCENCKNLTKNYMSDSVKKFWWCNNCNSIEIINV